jgi:predicted nucleic acid-binding protein
VSRVFFDTNLFIYLLEEAGARSVRVRSILERMSQRRDELLTSTLTLGEVLVKPLAAGDYAWADRYEKP